ncbi:MAG: hypothetical protein ABFD62_07915 [Syntrophaceae bacterium]
MGHIMTEPTRGRFNRLCTAAASAALARLAPKAVIDTLPTVVKFPARVTVRAASPVTIVKFRLAVRSLPGTITR